MLHILAIGLGGFIGAIIRYLISDLAYKLFGARFFYGTLIVNIIGSFALWLFLVLVNERLEVSHVMRGFVAVGVLGALTTFSTFSYETVALLQNSLYMKAGLNVFLNIVCALGAVWLGCLVAKVV